MNQQVNLYQAVEAPGGYWTLKRIGRIGAGFGLFLLLVSLVGWWRLGRADAALKRMEQQREEVLATLEERRRSGIAPQVMQMREQVRRMTVERDRRMQILERLRAGGFGNLKGFSPFLSGFALQRVTGLWFTDIRLAEGGRTLTLVGFAQSESLVTDLVQKLGAESAFKEPSLAFRRLVIQRAGNPEATIAFELSTDPVSDTPGAGEAAPALQVPADLAPAIPAPVQGAIGAEATP